MISNKTQNKLDRASKGLPDENLPMDDRQLQEEADSLGLTVEDLKQINDDFTDEGDEMDDDSGEPTNEDHANARYEQQRESEHTNG